MKENTKKNKKYCLDEGFSINDKSHVCLQDDPILETEVNANIGGSRLFQLFHHQPGSHNESQEHSRRSSLNDEFGYLNGEFNHHSKTFEP